MPAKTGLPGNPGECGPQKREKNLQVGGEPQAHLPAFHRLSSSVTMSTPANEIGPNLLQVLRLGQLPRTCQRSPPPPWLLSARRGGVGAWTPVSLRPGTASPQPRWRPSCFPTLKPPDPLLHLAHPRVLRTAAQKALQQRSTWPALGLCPLLTLCVHVCEVHVWWLGKGESTLVQPADTAHLGSLGTGLWPQGDPTTALAAGDSEGPHSGSAGPKTLLRKGLPGCHPC